MYRSDVEELVGEIVRDKREAKRLMEAVDEYVQREVYMSSQYESGNR